MPIADVKIFYKKNDQLVLLTGLKNEDTGNFYNNATVRLSLFDSHGIVVPNADGVLLAYIPGSNGDYKGQIEDLFDPPEGAGYFAVLTVESGQDKFHFRIPAEVQWRAR